MNVKKWSPWNWFRKEQEQQSAPATVGSLLPVQRYEEFSSPVLKLHREIDRMFEEAFRGLTFSMPGMSSVLDHWGHTDTPAMFRPVVDIAENDRSYSIRVEIPGVAEKDIQVQLEDDTLTIRGEKKLEKETQDENYHRIERSYGAFQRVLSLPDNANPETVKATFRNGVLTLTVDKNVESKPSHGRFIEIESAA